MAVKTLIATVLGSTFSALQIIFVHSLQCPLDGYKKQEKESAKGTYTPQGSTELSTTLWGVKKTKALYGRLTLNKREQNQLSAIAADFF